ncbi:MAG: MFS transporter [Desulfosarcina sp.]|nr:MFS transporter [Desulfobacterales bacterium]
MTSSDKSVTAEAASGTTSVFDLGKILDLSVSHFIHDVYSSFLAPLLPLLIEKLSLSLTQAGFLTTVMQIPALMNPYIGQLADRISVRYFVILAPALTAIPMSMIGVAPSYGVLLLLLFVAGISVAIFHVPAPVMVARLAGGHKGRGMSFFMTGGELARAVGPLTAVGAVSLMGLEGFYPIMLVGIVASGWLYWRFRKVNLDISDRRRKLSVRATWKGMHRVLGPLSAILVARGFMHAVMTAFLPIFIIMESGNLWLAGAALTIFEIAGVAGVLAAGSLSDHLGRRRMLLISLLGAPLSLLLFVYSGGWVRVAALLLTGFTLLSTTPVMLALVQEHADGSSPAAANGMFMMISFLARSAVVVVVGMIADGIGLHTTYVIAAAAGMTGIPFVLMLPRR